jgi:hypothetical protein
MPCKGVIEIEKEKKKANKGKLKRDEKKGKQKLMVAPQIPKKWLQQQQQQRY